MARTISQTAYVPGATHRWYFLMGDGTMWKFDDGTWTQAPAIPGGRVVTAIAARIDGYAPTPIEVDTVYAACTDGTIWSAQVLAPFVWIQVGTTPP